MSFGGKAIENVSSLSGKIHALVIDPTLSISGACADAKATGEAIAYMNDVAARAEDFMDSINMSTPEAVAELRAKTEAHIASLQNPHGVTAAQVGAYSKEETLTVAEIRAICV